MRPFLKEAGGNGFTVQALLPSERLGVFKVNVSHPLAEFEGSYF